MQMEFSQRIQFGGVSHQYFHAAVTSTLEIVREFYPNASAVIRTNATDIEEIDSRPSYSLEEFNEDVWDGCFEVEAYITRKTEGFSSMLICLSHHKDRNKTIHVYGQGVPQQIIVQIEATFGNVHDTYIMRDVHMRRTSKNLRYMERSAGSNLRLRTPWMRFIDTIRDLFKAKRRA